MDLTTPDLGRSRSGEDDGNGSLMLAKVATAPLPLLLPLPRGALVALVGPELRPLIEVEADKDVRTPAVVVVDDEPVESLSVEESLGRSAAAPPPPPPPGREAFRRVKSVVLRRRAARDEADAPREREVGGGGPDHGEGEVPEGGARPLGGCWTVAE